MSDNDQFPLSHRSNLVGAFFGFPLQILRVASRIRHNNIGFVEQKERLLEAYRFAWKAATTSWSSGMPTLIASIGRRDYRRVNLPIRRFQKLGKTGRCRHLDAGSIDLPGKHYSLIRKPVCIPDTGLYKCRSIERPNYLAVHPESENRCSN